jgi:hypothetical protein
MNTNLSKEEKRDKVWHLERGIPIATLAAMVIQTGAVVWWASGIDSRVAALEKDNSNTAWQAEKIIRMDEKLNGVQSSISELKTVIQQSSPRQK